jgi:hypothetical protein
MAAIAPLDLMQHQASTSDAPCHARSWKGAIAATYSPFQNACSGQHVLRAMRRSHDGRLLNNCAYVQGGHSFFCVYDASTGEVMSCPENSSGWAFCSFIVDRTEQPERAWAFCSAWDRANHTVNGQNASMTCAANESGWGCGGCNLAQRNKPGPGCSVGAWSSEDLVNWEGPFPAVTLPGNVTVPNVAVTMIPRSSRAAAAAQTGLPPHQVNIC